MEEPWGTCELEASPISNCVHKCNKRQAEMKCGCRDVFDDFKHLNIPDNNLGNSTHNCTIDSTIIEGSMSYGKSTNEIKAK